MRYNLSEIKNNNDKVIYEVYDYSGNWVASFTNKEDAENFIEMIKAREDDKDPLGPQ